jgi:hypothetical protein
LAMSTTTGETDDDATPGIPRPTSATRVAVTAAVRTTGREKAAKTFIDEN